MAFRLTPTPSKVILKSVLFINHLMSETTKERIAMNKTSLSLTPLQKRRVNFLKTVKRFFKKNPEHFQDMAPPKIQMITEESRLLKTYFVCHLPNRLAKFVGKVKGNKIFLVEVMARDKKIPLKKIRLQCQ
jgi:hypothetical protein